MLRVSVERWLQVICEAPARIRVKQTALEALDLKLRKAKRRGKSLTNQLTSFESSLRSFAIRSIG
jgi:hypothetical protein